MQVIDFTRSNEPGFRENYSQQKERIPLKKGENIYFVVSIFFKACARHASFCASAFFMNVFHTKPVRTFSAISSVIPVSMPMTSSSYHFVSGLKALTKPYRLHALRIAILDRAQHAHHLLRHERQRPAAAEGTTVPSIGPVAGGPPHTA